MKIAAISLAFSGLMFGQAPQAPNPTAQDQAVQSGSVPIYRVNVVSRTTKAINYHHRSGSTMINFRGTALMPEAKGDAKVESKQGVIKIDANMEKLRPASSYGPEFTTFVMWAITPEGRPVNVGEVVLNGGDKSKLSATTDLQSFGLIVTAEPYFAVTQPSDVVVMENFVRNDTTGTIEQVDAKYELLRRGQYTLNIAPASLQPLPQGPKVPLELTEARNAVRIARWAGAEKYAPDTFAKAVEGLNNAEGYLVGKAGKKPIGTVAREAVQMAEDARIITVRKREDEQLANERAAAKNREEQARAEADARALEARRAAEAADQAEQARARAQAESERLAQERAAAEQARSQAEQARAEAEAQRSQAEADKTAMRKQLLEQLNAIMETRDTARGLIMNMSDVLFDTGKHTLKPTAREKLAKVSGILISHPGLKLEVDGYTDSTGSEEFNQKLSEERAATVRDYLVQQGVPMDAVAARGFGESQPVASNDTARGRQQNRRVELVMSGDIIGNSQTSSLRTQR